MAKQQIQIVKCYVCKGIKPGHVIWPFVSSKNGIGIDGKTICKVCDSLDHLIRWGLLKKKYQQKYFNVPKGFDSISMERRHRIWELMKKRDEELNGSQNAPKKEM